MPVTGVCFVRRTGVKPGGVVLVEDTPKDVWLPRMTVRTFS